LPKAATAPIAIPTAAPVFRWATSKAHQQPCAGGAPMTVDGYPVAGTGPGGCADLGPLTSESYLLAAPPAGATLVYVAVPDGAYGYLEPAFKLPDGDVITALTPDELRP
jgi:hypothetical protein